MGQSFSLGRIKGIQIGMNWSVLLIVALLAYGLAAGQFPAAVPGLPEWEYVTAALVTALAYMGSLLAHELAHSLVARHNGLEVSGITLWLLGGVSQLQGEVPDPAAEVRIAGVGPLTSLILGVVFSFLAVLLHEAGVTGVVVAALAWLGGINILLAVFNVIPAAPLDGGRLLRAFLWRVTGDKTKSSEWAARSGQFFGWALVIVSAYLVLARGLFDWIWFAILGWFLISAASSEGQQAVLQSRLRSVAVRQVMTPNPVTVPSSATVTEFLNDLLPRYRHSAFPVVSDGETVGLVTVHHANQVHARDRDRTTLGQVACPLAQVAQASPDEPVADVLSRLNECSEGRALVFSGGHLVGIVSPTDINQAVERLSRYQGPYASARS
jgi:Zn-dependent protease/predicted transcriptional regulator